MCDRRRESFANYPTWEMYIWLVEDKERFNYYLKKARTYLEIHEGDRETALEDLTVNMSFDAKYIGGDERLSVYTNILGWALDMVDYGELAKVIFDEMDKADTGAKS